MGGTFVTKECHPFGRSTPQLCKDVLENPQVPQNHDKQFKKFITRDEVVRDEVEHDDMLSLDMTDRGMGYQSFQGASTPSNTSSNV